MNLDKLKDPYVIILIGPPLSGKTTWINKNFEPGSFELISRDQIVLDLHGEDDYNTAFNTVDQKEVDRILKECDKIIFLHHSYKPNPIIKNYLHKTYLTFVHAFIPDMLGLNNDYENIMTKVDWVWQKKILLMK